MPRPPASSLLTLPTELILNIFILSSNPALVLTCRALNYTIAPHSKSNSTRTSFLLGRYRNNYVKAVVKGLRWSFFDLDVLNALDQIYARDLSRIAEENSSQDLLLSHSYHPAAVGSATRFHAWETVASPSPIGEISDVSVSSPSTPTVTPEKRPLRGEQPEESTRKKRRKYPLPPPIIRNPVAAPIADQLTDAITTTEGIVSEECLIPLPKDFAIPRRLFKSDKHMVLLRGLLSRGGSPSHTSHYPLVRASQRGDVEMVRMLLAFGAPAEMKALRWACVEEHDEIVELFLEYGVKPDDQCLSWCVEKGKSRMIDKLLKMGVVPNLKTVLGF
ncbi:hypothetical protein BGX23_000172 [Mortierella sp. AD031]|nr:hypothetical protein BGX23_000172 [Mortierella sp. AD031]